MRDDHGTQIKRLEAEIEATRPELEAACDSFLDAAAACLADFWPGYIDRCIRHAGEAVGDMNQNRLREVKAAVEEVQACPRDAVQEHLLDDRRGAMAAPGVDRRACRDDHRARPAVVQLGSPKPTAWQSGWKATCRRDSPSRWKKPPARLPCRCADWRLHVIQFETKRGGS